MVLGVAELGLWRPGQGRMWLLLLVRRVEKDRLNNTAGLIR